MTRDEYIQTEVMGKCWHEWQGIESTYGWSSKCQKCGKIEITKYTQENYPNFSTSPYAYELQQFVLRAEWWDEFVWYAFWSDEDMQEARNPAEGHYTAKVIAWLFSDASRFADLVAEFRGWTVNG